MPQTEAEFPELVLPPSGAAERVVVIQYETDPHDNEAPVLAWVDGKPVRAEVIERAPTGTRVRVYLDEGANDAK